MTSPITDAQYYQVARPNSLSERVVIAARDRIYADFLRHCALQPKHSILDIGASDVVTDAANVLERLYPYPEKITAAGLGDGAAFIKEYPRVEYRQIQADTTLPFADKSFDIATANAVLEHVGSVSAQRRFIAEMMRVSRVVYITVPNRYFPVEHHTGFPFVHYSDILFALACKLAHKDEWTQEKNLIFMTRKKLHALVPASAQASIGYTGFPLDLFSSNLYVHINQVV